MRRNVSILAAVLVTVTMMGIGGAEASSAPARAREVADAVTAPAGGPELTPRVRVNSPWGKDDTVGDAPRPQGDLRRIIVENGRVQMHFTFRTVATPLWDNASTDRTTGMVFDMDWLDTTAPPNRTLVVTRDDGVWSAAIFNGGGHLVCSRTGGVRQLTNHRFNISAPVQTCLGGPHVLRIGSGFVDDQDDTAGEDLHTDLAPNTNYGPFIRLPARSRPEAAAVGGWTVH
jgi:hypothetical protein